MASNKEERRRKAISMGSAPSMLLSGYLTKRTRSLNRWVKRWWQLLDDGTLIYFKSDDRVKLLGEIDIGRTCYDVRLGAQHCKAPFPRAVAPGCCFAVSVLKRTYYLFASTPAEAKQWAEHITNLSAVLNRRRRPAPKPPAAALQRSTSELPKKDPAERVKLRARARERNGVAMRHSVAVLTPQEADKLDQELRDEPSDLPVFRPRKPMSQVVMQSPQVMSLSQPAPSSTPLQFSRLQPRYRHGSLPSSLDQLCLFSYPYSNGNTTFSPNSSQVSVLSPGVVLRTRSKDPRLQMTRVSSFGSADGGRTSSQSSDLSRDRSKSEPEGHQGSENGSPTTQSNPAKLVSRQSLPAMVPPSYMQLGLELERLQERETALRKRLAQTDEPQRPISLGNYKPDSLTYLARPSSQTNQSMPSPTASPSSSDIGSSSTDPSPQILRKRPGSDKIRRSPPVLPKPTPKGSGYIAATQVPLSLSLDDSDMTDGTAVDTSTAISQNSHESAPPPASNECSDTSDFSSAGAGDASQQLQSPLSPSTPHQTSPPNSDTSKFGTRSRRRPTRPPPPLPSYPPPPLPSYPPPPLPSCPPPPVPPCPPPPPLLPSSRPQPPAIARQNGTPLSPLSPSHRVEHVNGTMNSTDTEKTSRDSTNKNQLQLVSSQTLL